MTNSPSSMPGAFNPPPTGAAPPRLSGAKSHIFQPPRTPNGGASASNSLILTRSVGSVMSLDSTSTYRDYKRGAAAGVRKRGREEFDGGSNGRGGTGEYGNAQGNANGYAVPESPAPLVNTRYQLAGGLDTPGLLAAQVEDSGYEDMNSFRKSLGSRPVGSYGEIDEGESYFPGEARDRGLKQSPNGGWSKAAIQVAGVVVGKAWEFCKSSAAVFGGFRAGGGTGYKATNGAHFEVLSADEQNFWEEKNAQSGRDETLPGQFPDDLDYIPDYMDHPTADRSTTPERPNKRRQVSASNINEGLERNWVVVPPAPPVAPKSQIARGVPRYSMPTTSSGGRRGLGSTTSRPASAAGFRAAPGANPRRTPGLNARVSHAGSPSLNAASRASFASPRSPVSTSPATSRLPRATVASPLRKQNSSMNSGSGDVPESPAAQKARQEAQKWAMKKEREDREVDEGMSRLDQQLRDLIREGKEALGTRVSVEFEEDDEGHNTPMSPSKLPRTHSRQNSAFGATLGHSRQNSSFGASPSHSRSGSSLGGAGTRKWNV